jgi:hypothetical protein
MCNPPCLGFFAVQQLTFVLLRRDSTLLNQLFATNCFLVTILRPRRCQHSLDTYVEDAQQTHNCMRTLMALLPAQFPARTDPAIQLTNWIPNSRFSIARTGVFLAIHYHRGTWEFGLTSPRVTVVAFCLLLLLLLNCETAGYSSSKIRCLTTYLPPRKLEYMAPRPGLSRLSSLAPRKGLNW